jgi:ABC-type multidrug transport system fused ATPase/permease subunit
VVLMTSLGLAYALPMVSLLSSMLTTSAQVEQEMVSVERTLQFIHLPAAADCDLLEAPPHAGERPKRTPCTRPAHADAPTSPRAAMSCRDTCNQLRSTSGAVQTRQRSLMQAPRHAGEATAPHTGSELQYEAVCLTYPCRRVPALDLVSFLLPEGKTCGICGRTGAGKSSLLNALFRLAPMQKGRILVGGLDIASVPAQCASTRTRAMQVGGLSVPQLFFTACLPSRLCHEIVRAAGSCGGWLR